MEILTKPAALEKMGMQFPRSVCAASRWDLRLDLVFGREGWDQSIAPSLAADRCYHQRRWHRRRQSLSREKVLECPHISSVPTERLVTYVKRVMGNLPKWAWNVPHYRNNCGFLDHVIDFVVFARVTVNQAKQNETIFWWEKFILFQWCSENITML